MTCVAEARSRARKAQAALAACACVEDVTLLPPAADPSDRWTLDIVAWSEDGRVPWPVARVLGRYRLDHRAAPQGATVQILAVA